MKASDHFKVRRGLEIIQGPGVQEILLKITKEVRISGLANHRGDIPGLEDEPKDVDEEHEGSS